MLEITMKQGCELLLALQDINVNLNTSHGEFGQGYIGMGHRIKDVLKHKIEMISKRLMTAKILNKYVSVDLKFMVSQDEMNEIADLLEKWEKASGQ